MSNAKYILFKNNIKCFMDKVIVGLIPTEQIIIIIIIIPGNVGKP